ncbi:MAG: hypothetical protein OHK0045_00800 [Raineya sp.]
MKALKLIISFILFVNTLQGQDYQFFVTINLSDCLNCILPLKKISKSLENSAVTFVFQEQDKRVAKATLKKQLNIDIDDKKVIYSDSLYATLNKQNKKDESSFFVLWKGFVIKSFKLASLNEQQISSFKNIKIKNSKILPDSILLSNSIKSAYYRGNLVLLDRKFNTIYLINTKDKNSLKVFQENHFDKVEIYKSILGDTSGFYDKIAKHSELLSDYGKNGISINNFTIDESGILYVDISIYYVETLEKSIGVIPISVLAKLGPSTEYYKYAEPKFFNENAYYGFLSNSNFEVLKGRECITMIAHNKPDTTVNLFAKVILKEKDKHKQVEFKDFYKLKYPKFGQDSNTEYMFVGGKMVYPFYFFYFENMYADIETGQYFKLLPEIPNTNWEKAKKSFYFNNYQLIDIIKVSPNTYKALISILDAYFIVELDFKSNSSKIIEEVILPPKNNKKLSISTFSFLNEKTLYLITPENDFVEVEF